MTRESVRVTFWGTRGSLATPGPRTLQYGGNTPCVEVRAADGTLVVLDCGTGAHELGRSLLADGRGRRGHLLISHTHWDHIQGFPFFAPLFVAGNEWDIYAPQGLGQHLEATLAGQMQSPYFPVTLRQLAATVRYHDLAEGAFDIGAVRVTAQYLNHPGLAMGYRLESSGVVIVYATDHEPHSRHHPGSATPIHPEDRRHVEFLAGADLVIHDAQYTASEYPERLTWGHSPAEWTVDFAAAAGARRLALFHHDPVRDDAAVNSLVAACRVRARDHGSVLDIFGAAEGQVIDLEVRGAAATSLTAPPVELRRASEPPIVLVADDETDVLDMLEEVLEREGFIVLRAADGATALSLVRERRPDVLLLDWVMPGLDGIEVCRAVRSDADPRIQKVPVILVTAMVSAEDTAKGFAAGVNDYVTKPFKPTQIVARVNAWLLRQAEA